MKKFILVLSLLPLVSFGYNDDFFTNGFWRVDIYYFDSVTSSNFYPLSDVSTVSDVVLAYQNFTFGFVLYNDSIQTPLLTDSNGGKRSASFDYQIVAYTNSSNSRCCYSSRSISSIDRLYKMATDLYLSGYRGSGITYVGKRSNRYDVLNFNYRDSISDILASTNSVYRSIVLNHLAFINSSLSSIGSFVGTINTDYQSVNNLYLDPSKQNLLDSAANPSSLNANSSIAANLDRLFGSSYAGREAEISKALSELACSQLQAAWLSTLDPDSPFYMQNLDNIISDPQTFQQAALQGGGGGGSAFANIMRDVKKLSTNDWVSGVTNQLSNNRASITNQLAHMFDDDTNVGSKLTSIESSAGSIDERLARGITVSVVNSGANSVLVSLDGPINIDSPQFNSLSVPLGSLQSTVSDWYSDWYTFFNYSDPSYRWSNFYNMVSAFKDQNHSDLFSLLSLTNSLSGIDSLLRDCLPQITNSFSSDFSALLLDDYDDYISNAHFSSFLSDLQNNYPDVYSDLEALGLSSQSGSGNWWTLAGSSLGYISAQVHSNVVMFSSVFGDIQRVKQFADDNGNFNGDFYSAASDVISSIPSKTQVANYIEQCTNAANSVSALELVSFYSTASNEVNKVFRLFNRGSNLPSEVVIMHHGLNGEHTFSIPVGDQPRLWLLIRLGIMFVTCAVNLILLPKFILRIFILFMTMFKKSIPYLNSDYN